MQIIPLIIILIVLFKMLANYESPSKRIRRNDNDPNCMFKSDGWYKKNRGD